MLKIKDNVDLKDLKKYEFITAPSLIDKYKWCKDRIIAIIYDKKKRKTNLIIDKWNRIFLQDWENLDYIYDLIKANLVEKVSDDNE